MEVAINVLLSSCSNNTLALEDSDFLGRDAVSVPLFLDVFSNSGTFLSGESYQEKPTNMHTIYNDIFY
jgi:hypothetical protein